MRNILQSNISEIDWEDIGRRIRQRRQVLGLTQESLANNAGIETPTLNRIENNRTKIRLDSLIKIANALEVSTDELLRNSLRNANNRTVYQGEIMEQLKNCNEKELHFVKQIIIFSLQQLRKTFE